jgi:hypothetical protein
VSPPRSAFDYAAVWPWREKDPKTCCGSSGNASAEDGSASVVNKEDGAGNVEQCTNERAGFDARFMQAFGNVMQASNICLLNSPPDSS